MARPIKETPILTGEEAARFIKMAEAKPKKISSKELKKMQENYEKIKRISTFL